MRRNGLLTPLTYVHVGHAEEGQQGKQDREVIFGQRLSNDEKKLLKQAIQKELEARRKT